MYDPRKTPEEEKCNSTKKAGADRCESFRTISLITKTIQKIMERKVEKVVAESQVGFRKKKKPYQHCGSSQKKQQRKTKQHVIWKKWSKAGKGKYRKERIIYNLHKKQVAIVGIEQEVIEAEI